MPMKCTFRDQSIAASLKLLPWLHLLVEHHHFPRSIDRGLIEAYTFRTLAQCRRWPFRDQSIAASLKQKL